MFKLLNGNPTDFDEIDEEKELEEVRSQINQLQSQVMNIKSNNHDNVLQRKINETKSLNKLKPNAELKKRKDLVGHFGKIYSLGWNNNGNNIVSASQDGKLLVWDVHTSNKTLAIPLKSAWVMTCCFSPSNNLVSSGGLDNVASIYDVKDAVGWEVRQPVAELQSHEGYISSIEFIDDNKILTGSGDSTCILWDLNKNKSETFFTEHGGDVQSISLHNDKNLFISGAIDRTIKVWDHRNGDDSICTFKGHKTDVNSVKWFPNGNSLGSGSDDSSTILWDLRCYRQLNIYEDNENLFSTITEIDFSKSGYYLFCGYDDNPYCIAWNVLTGKRDKTLLHTTRVSTLQMSPDGYSLATGCWDKTLRLWV
mmetsp:Transcript_16012/g.19629  ORF Transcript_16012/g.19629 Transcript_16012/m.19629 type:complete len:366 (+) Transcript_16012:28-1125(+)